MCGRETSHTFHRWQTQLPRDLRIPHFARILQRHSPNQFRQVGARSDGAAATECFEFDVRDGVGGGVDLDLELHHVAAGGGTDETCANGGGVLVHGTDVAGGGVVV